MNYAELKTAVLEDTHRPDLDTLVGRFIREGEGMIRRDLTAWILTTTLSDTERVVADGPIYQLPEGALIIRRIAPQVTAADAPIRSDVIRVSLDAIGRHALTDNVHSYAETGNNTIEFRGNPAIGSVLNLDYFGMPDTLVDDADTNDLLENHETLYKAGAMFYLYQHSQDRELASDALDVFNGVMGTLNEQIGRKIGGAKITQSYNFNGGSSY